MEKVTVNKSLLIGAVAVAAVSLLALAFILGRASGPGRPAPPASGSGLSQSPVPPAAADPRITDERTQPPSGSQLPPASMPEPPEGRPPSGLDPALPGDERGVAASDPDRAAVAAYFDAVDHLQPGKMSGDPEATAREMAAALAKGDTSELDRMIRETEAAKASLVAVTPPPSCTAHYRESLGSLDDALGMLRSLKGAMESPDPAAQLAGVASRAGALRSRSEALQNEELALRLRYGLPR